MYKHAHIPRITYTYTHTYTHAHIPRIRYTYTHTYTHAHIPRIAYTYTHYIHIHMPGLLQVVTNSQGVWYRYVLRLSAWYISIPSCRWSRTRKCGSNRPLFTHLIGLFLHSWTLLQVVTNSQVRFYRDMRLQSTHAMPVMLTDCLSSEGVLIGTFVCYRMCYLPIECVLFL